MAARQAAQTMLVDWFEKGGFPGVFGELLAQGGHCEKNFLQTIPADTGSEAGLEYQRRQGCGSKVFHSVPSASMA